MKYFYKNITDKEPTEVEVIQRDDKRKRVEIIRKSQIKNREKYSGFWINESELIIDEK